jgi:hypothetical protein
LYSLKSEKSLPDPKNMQETMLKKKLNLVSFRYFQAGGNPEQVIQLLSGNYSAVAQTANLLAEWLILAGKYDVHFFKWCRLSLKCNIIGAKVTDVQAMVENHLKEMVLKTFDPKKADTIFTEEGEVWNLILCKRGTLK